MPLGIVAYGIGPAISSCGWDNNAPSARPDGLINGGAIATDFAHESAGAAVVQPT